MHRGSLYNEIQVEKSLMSIGGWVSGSPFTVRSCLGDGGLVTGKRGPEVQ